ncbi:Alpha/Beta hydrolase protein [Xylariaceae sp. FL1651]|nr:Alpha/Beta hydrolase protein [Xylariaceae sp. FL1651]
MPLSKYLPTRFKQPQLLRQNKKLPTMSQYSLDIVVEGQDPKVDIVFVHGLGGEKMRTWTRDGIFWPGQLLPSDVPEARILVFGYDANVVRLEPGNITKTELHGNADDLCSKLIAERSNVPEAADRPIIIIAHSLGGLVTAQLFNHGEQSADGLNAKTIVEKIRGMIFLGTPFRGSVLAGPAENVRRILQLVGIPTQEDTLKQLGINSEKTNELTRAFSNLLNKRKGSDDQIHAFFFYETLPTSLKGKYVQIVENDSAQLPGCGDPIPVRADHHNICKFVSKTDDGYKQIVAAIRKSLAPKAQDGASGGTWYNNYGQTGNMGPIAGDQHNIFH